MRSIARPFRRLYCAPLRVAATTLSLTLLLALLASPGSLFAQPAAVPNAARITQTVDESKLVTLKGNVSRATLVSDDRGAAPVSQPMSHVQLVLKRSAAQESALNQFMSTLQVKSSPNYHKWLTPEQFGKLYGPADADIQKLTAWLEGHGFTVNQVPKSRTYIDFSGSVAQVQSAFHTSIHTFHADQTSFIANVKDPRIPAALAGVVSGVAHLNTVPLKPQYAKAVPARYDKSKHRFIPQTQSSEQRPQLTLQDNNGNFYLYAVPADAATIYNVPNQNLNAKFSGSTSYDGTGVNIGIAGQTAIDPTVVANYRNLFLGDTKQPNIINLDNVGVTGDEVEAFLDNEISGGLAPGASLFFYTASTDNGGVFYAAEQAILDNSIDILSVSYGNCELNQGTAGNQLISQIWQEAAAQGITVVVAAGDDGSAGCDATTDNAGNNIPTAVGGLAVNGLASTPYNIAVGGTDYDVLASQFSNYVSTDPGDAQDLFLTAGGYIPEATWNNSTQENGTVSQNQPLTGSDANIVAGSGGQSNCAVQDATGTCTQGYAKPGWQTAVGVPNDNVRDLPDVSFLAGNAAYFATWAICDNQVDSGGFTLDCSLDSNNNFSVDGAGGTSAATPAFAGMMALIVQKTGQRQGQAAPVLYSLANSSNASSIFNDVVTGNNSVACTAGSPNCVQNTAGYYFESGFDTNVGYDLATGLGSLNVTALANNWANASALFTPVLALNVSPTTITSAQPFTVSVTASGPSGSPTPTGSVTVAVGSYVSPTATALVNGVASVTVPGSTLTSPGAYLVLVSYTPDTASSKVYYYGSATSVVTVSGTAPGGTINIGSPAPTTATVSSPGQSGTSTITLTPAGGYTGTVNFTCTLATAPTGAATAYNPACSIPATKVTGTAAQTVTASFSTTAPTSGALAYPETNREGRWYTAVGGAALACILFFGIPARRRGWRSMLSLLFFLVAMAGVGCGGGGGGNNNGTPGTTTGTYTFNVTATDSAVATITSNATITVTVQ